MYKPLAILPTTSYTVDSECTKFNERCKCVSWWCRQCVLWDYIINRVST